MKKTKVFAAMVVLLFASIFIAGCGGGENLAPAPTLNDDQFSPLYSKYNLSGTVRIQQTGAPVSGAPIAVKSGSGAMLSGSTAPDGSFTFSQINGGSIDITVGETSTTFATTTTGFILNSNGLLDLAVQGK